MNDPTKHLNQIESIVGPEAVRTQANLKGRDPGIDTGNLGASLWIAPETTQDVSTLLAFCNEEGIAVVPHGGLTGLSGAATTSREQVIISSARLNTQCEIDPAGGTALVAAGMTLDQLNAAAAEHELIAGIDIGSRGTTTLGGMVATNAGGGDAFRNGVMRQQVLGLEAVTADGTVLSDLKRVSKANEGLDVKQLFIGSEGTLGMITRVVVKLETKRDVSSTALVACDSASQALQLFERLNANQANNLIRAEIMWRAYAHVTAKDLGLTELLSFADRAVYVIFQTAHPTTGETADDDSRTLERLLATAMLEHDMTDAILAQNERERANMWRIREDSWGVQRQYPHGHWFDVSVPRANIDAYLETVTARLQAIDAELRVFVMGHLGDGNLHFTITKGTPIDSLYDHISIAIYDGLQEQGGSFSAEHGIGTEKKSALAAQGDPGKLKLMHAVKQVLDPKGIMNPGKVFQ